MELLEENIEGISLTLVLMVIFFFFWIWCQKQKSSLSKNQVGLHKLKISWTAKETINNWKGNL